jgi:hypothetical protein
MSTSTTRVCFLLFHCFQDKSFHQQVVYIDCAGEVRRFGVYTSDICSQTGSAILFDTPNYPEECAGFGLQYNKKRLEMYHFQPHSGE